MAKYTCVLKENGREKTWEASDVSSAYSGVRDRVGNGEPNKTEGYIKANEDIPGLYRKGEVIKRWTNQNGRAKEVWLTILLKIARHTMACVR